MDRLCAMSLSNPAVVETQTPESLFRVGIPHDEGDLGWTLMQTGPWMNDPAGLTAAGSIGVLVDDSLGHQVFMTRPAHTASVTSELSMDILVPPPWSTREGPGAELRAESRLLHKDADGGFAECRVFNDAEQLIAVATTWCRFIPLPDNVVMPESEEDWILDTPGNKHTLFDVLGARLQSDESGVRLVLAPSTDLTNPLGIAHGGVLIAGTEIAGNHAVSAVMAEPVTTSIRMNYLRPAPMDAELTFTTEVMHRGRSVSVARVTSVGTSGKPCSVGTVTCRRVARES